MHVRPLLGIDASRSSRKNPTGVERYSTEIIQALLPLLDGFDVRLYTPQLIPGFPRALQRVLRAPRLWSLVRLSWEMLWHKPRVLFIPAHVLPFFAPKRSFVTIHDLAFRKIPAAYGWFQRGYLDWSTRRAVRKCERIFVPSTAVAEDLKHFYGAHNVRVVPHGPLHLPSASVKHSSEPLFFFLGRLEEKKNIVTLLEAWDLVEKKYPHARLIIAGSWGYGINAILCRAEAQMLRGSVKIPSYISEAEVAVLFHSATAFVFPSLEEGFGFPLLQAFSANCPVICSDIPALREVGGDAALYAGTRDVEEFARAMIRLLEAPALRDRLAKAGSERLKLFSWTKAARELASSFVK